MQGLTLAIAPAAAAVAVAVAVAAHDALKLTASDQAARNNGKTTPNEKEHHLNQTFMTLGFQPLIFRDVAEFIEFYWLW